MLANLCTVEIQASVRSETAIFKITLMVAWAAATLFGHTISDI